MLRNLSIRLKLAIIVMVFILGLMGLAAQLLAEERQAMHEAKINEIRALSELAVSLLSEYEAMNESGVLSLWQAQLQARNALRDLRFGNDEYFYVYDYHGTNVVLGPAPEREGTDMIDITDANGVPLIRSLIAVAHEGGGSVNYVWPRAGSDTPIAKVGYALPFDAWGWFVGTGFYVEDLEAAFEAKLAKAGWIIAVIITVSSGLALVIARTISNGVTVTASTMHRLANGESGVTIPFRDQTEEIGQMARAVEVFAHKTSEAGLEAMRQERLEAEHRAESERRAALLNLAEQLESRVKSATEQILSASVDNRASAESIAVAGQRTVSTAQGVERTTQSVNRRIHSVASTAQHLTTSIQEIAEQVASSTEVARQATEMSGQATSRMADLTQKAERINDIIEMITAIANQTNLLALNATIEAARAGDAGRAFSVVATEVKALAQQSAKAADDIAQQLVSVQTLSRDSAEAIGGITEVIDQMATMADRVAVAVEQQAGGTTEIAETMQLTAQEAAEVAENMVEVITAEEATQARVNEVTRASATVSNNAEQLEREVESFIGTIRGEASELISWSDDFLVGHPTLDHDHKQLFKLVNQLNGAMISGQGNMVISKVLAGLINYTADHFKREEELMAKHNYPDYQEHKGIHEDLVGKVLDLQARLDAGENVMSQEVMLFLKTWLTGHIMGSDTRLAQSLKG